MSSSPSSSSMRTLGPSHPPGVPQNPPSYDDSRQQAGPLPSKRGELGFVEGVHTPREANHQEITMPARHPADRGNDETPTVAVPLTPGGPNGAAAAGSTNEPPTSDPAPSPSSSSSSADPSKPSGIRKPIAAFQGMRLSTLLAFSFQLTIFAGFIVAWVLTAQKLSSMSKNGGTIPGGMSSTVFLHAMFAFAVIGQLIFLERRVYRLRAERYTFLHPGEMLPRYHQRTEPGGDLSFSFAPWNRPPLPTYAAALAQSGHGTGDVDDHLIAVPPPPAYGNTRGSTLLLQGYLRNSLRAQRPPSVHSENDVERGEVNRDDHRQDTLAQLERTRTRQ